jgi:hypothetical protein
MADLPEGWAIEGLWDSGDYNESTFSGRDFTDYEIGHADAIVISYVEEGWDEPEYVTIHGADDYESLIDLIQDYDTESYFG